MFLWKTNYKILEFTYDKTYGNMPFSEDPAEIDMRNCKRYLSTL